MLLDRNLYLFIVVYTYVLLFLSLCMYIFYGFMDAFPLRCVEASVVLRCMCSRYLSFNEMITVLLFFFFIFHSYREK